MGIPCAHSCVAPLTRRLLLFHAMPRLCRVRLRACVYACVCVYLHMNSPQFAVFRTILQPASFHHYVATNASATRSNVEWVDPVTMGMLVKLHLTGRVG
jgi:hypothetical protein